MPLSKSDWTVEMVHALPDDGNRYEIIDGELFVTPAPIIRHQRAAFRLAHLLAPYTDALNLDVLLSPADIIFSPRTLVQPDVFVLPTIDGQFAKRFEDVGSLVLAVEVLSPSTARVDRNRKRMLYQQYNVPEYWIVDAAARMVERWRSSSVEPEILTSAISWQPQMQHEPLVLDLAEYFRSVSSEG